MKNKRKLIAEIGGNHEGDFILAKEILDSALETNVDVVKFQIYTGDTLVNKNISKQRNQHFKKFELSIDNYLELAEITTSKGKEFNASIWDMSLFDPFHKYLNFFKIGSGDFTNIHLLKQLSQFKKPFYFSTGLCDCEEVEKVVSYVKSLNNFYKKSSSICLMQCTSMYPIKKTDCNLSVLKNYKKLNVDLGYSDHTEDNDAMVTAYTLGAKKLEFHYTLKKLKTNEFRDHKVSLVKSEVDDLINKLNIVDKLLGNSDKRPTQIEIDSGHVSSFRRGVYFHRDMIKGEVVKENDLVFLRPNNGISAIDYKLLIGRKCKKSILALDPLNIDLFE